MTLLVLSDLHLAPEGPHLGYAGGDALGAAVAALAGQVAHVVLNGDTFDFLANEDPLSLDEARAAAQLDQILATEGARALVTALAAHLDGGGQVTVRLGNHDLELALPAVRERLRRALVAPGAGDPGARLVFDAAPFLALTVGGRAVCVHHGEAVDRWNRFPYSSLPSGDGFRYPPGSRLVKEFLNPARREYGLRFIDALKPEFEAAVLAALAVRPGAVSLLRNLAWAGILRQLARRSADPYALHDPGGPRWQALDHLGDDDRLALRALLQGGELGFPRVVDEGFAARLLRAALSGAGCALHSAASGSSAK